MLTRSCWMIPSVPSMRTLAERCFTMSSWVYGRGGKPSSWSPTHSTSCPNWTTSSMSHGVPQVLRLTGSVMNQGEITERGTYSSLVQQGGQFCNLVTDFGIRETSTDDGSEETMEDENAADEIVIAKEKIENKAVENQAKLVRNTRKTMGAAAGTGKLEVRTLSEGPRWDSYDRVA